MDNVESEMGQSRSDAIGKDFERIEEPAIYGLRQWENEWLLLPSAMASNLMTQTARRRLILVAQ